MNIVVPKDTLCQIVPPPTHPPTPTHTHTHTHHLVNSYGKHDNVEKAIIKRALLGNLNIHSTLASIMGCTLPNTRGNLYSITLRAFETYCFYLEYKLHTGAFVAAVALLNSIPPPWLTIAYRLIRSDYLLIDSAWHGGTVFGIIEWRIQ